jgi:hypothetical protein
MRNTAVVTYDPRHQIAITGVSAINPLIAILLFCPGHHTRQNNNTNTYGIRTRAVRVMD